MYFNALRDPITDMIYGNIPDMIKFLEKNYCRLSPEVINAREDALKSYVHNPEDPVDLVFNKINVFHNLCTITWRVKTDV